jgi:hypothetical protein
MLILSVFMLIFCTSGTVMADSSNINNISAQTTTSVLKVWTVSFSSAIDLTSVISNIQVKDLSTGVNVSVTVTAGNNDSSVRINPPSGGYTSGDNYEMTVNGGAESNTGVSLGKTTVMDFNVSASNSGGGSTSSNGSGSTSAGGTTSTTSYTASAEVVVSPMISIIKKITITNSSLPSTTKVKIDGNNNVYNISDPIVSLVGGNTTNVYFYNSDGTTLIATGTLDVSQSNSSASISFTN